MTKELEALIAKVPDLVGDGNVATRAYVEATDTKAREADVEKTVSEWVLDRQARGKHTTQMDIAEERGKLTRAAAEKLTNSAALVEQQRKQMNEHLAKLSREAERMVPQWKLMGPTAGDYPIAMMRQADEFAMATVRAEVSNYMPTQVLNRLNQAYSDNDDAAIRVLEADLWLRGAVSYQKPTLADVKAMTRMLETVRSARAARRAQVPAISALADAINKLPGQKAAERQVIQITAARRIA